MQTHLEPLAEEIAGTRPRAAGRRRRPRDHRADRRATTTGTTPQELRFLHTDEGLVAFLTLRLGGGTALADAHAQASRIEEAIRRERPEIADVIVHTEPSA